MIEISSGHAGLDVFLANGYQQTRGMSSRFAAAICGRVICRQSKLDIAGDLVEIGAFEGRFFIAMALLLQRGEHALGIDLFTWPNPGVYDRFLDNCDRAGLRPENFTAWKADTRMVTVDELRARLPNGLARFVHVDGEHIPECLTQDLELAHAVLHPDGVIAVDDMLHPGYPTLITTVLDYLARHPEMRVLCIVDRESITAAAKFLICRIDRVTLYEQDLMTTFARFHYIVGTLVMDHFTLVLTPDPRPPELD